MRSTFTALAGTALAAGMITNAAAEDMIVDKHVFEKGAYETEAGETIPDVEIGYETYGELNEDGDNAILITHFFSGTSHAAGRYDADQENPGYWDHIIGPGKPIDTDEYFVISSDTLVNLNVHDPNVTTTGPASTNPETGEPWGMDFPIVTIRDFVNVQKALLDELGVNNLEAVMGASMGSLQAFEWANAYPDMVERIIPVIGAAEATPFLAATVDLWGAPIRMDPNWQGGDYYDGEPPKEGLKVALQLIAIQARHPDWAEDEFGRAWTEEGADPAESWDNTYAIQNWMREATAAQAEVTDANHLLYLARANKLFVTGHDEDLESGLDAVDADVLLLPAAGDLLLFPEYSERARDLLDDGTREVDLVALEGPLGHLDGVVGIDQASDRIRSFLNE